MGCDIHMYIEKMRNGKWVPAQGFVEIDDGVIDVPYNDRFSDRDYLLFGMLAGVRDSTNQMFEPKGFPSDASPELNAVYKGWEPVAHTPSYLTLAELNGLNWDGSAIIIKRMFQKNQLKAFRNSVKKGDPDYSIIQSWCSWASDRENWVEAEIQVPMKYQFSRFYYNVVSRLHSYDRRCNENEIRIVFWFDN